MSNIELRSQPTQTGITLEGLRDFQSSLWADYAIINTRKGPAKFSFNGRVNYQVTLENVTKYAGPDVEMAIRTFNYLVCWE